MLLGLLLVPAFAYATSVSEEFITTDKGLGVGMAASQTHQGTEGKRTVERASISSADRFVGVVTGLDDSGPDSDVPVLVATLGEVSVVASDINGEIKKGDFVTLSPLKGIVMRAADSDTNVLGTALEDFSNEKAKTQEVNSNNGGKRTVLINNLKMDLNPRNVARSAKDTAFLVVFGRSLTGKSVSQIQVVVALVIFFFLLVVEGSIVYGAIYSTITALGRNPLARKVVYKQLFQVSLAAFVILAFGLSVIYVVLWA
jgi:hypothetical protein